MGPLGAISEFIGNAAGWLAAFSGTARSLVAGWKLAVRPDRRAERRVAGVTALAPLSAEMPA